MCALVLLAPLPAKRLFHRHFSQHKYAYDSFGLLSGQSQDGKRLAGKKEAGGNVQYLCIAG